MSIAEKIAMLNKKVNENKEKINPMTVLTNNSNTKAINISKVVLKEEKDKEKDLKPKKILLINEPEIIIRHINKPDNFKNDLNDIIKRRNLSCLNRPINGASLKKNDKENQSIISSIVQVFDRDEREVMRRGLEGRLAKSVKKSNEVKEVYDNDLNYDDDVNYNIDKPKGVTIVTKKKILKRNF